MKNKKILLFLSAITLITAIMITVIIVSFNSSNSDIAGTYETDEGIKVFLSEDGIVSNSDSEYGYWSIEGKTLILSFNMPDPSDTEFSDYFEETSQNGLYRKKTNSNLNDYGYLSGVNIYYNNTLEKLNKDIDLIQIPRYIYISLSISITLLL